MNSPPFRIYNYVLKLYPKDKLIKIANFNFNGIGKESIIFTIRASLLCGLSQHFDFLINLTNDKEINNPLPFFLHSLRDINLFQQPYRLFSCCLFNFHFFHFFHLTARIEEQLHRIGEFCFFSFILVFLALSLFPVLPPFSLFFFLFTSLLSILPFLSVLPFSTCRRQVSLSSFSSTRYFPLF